MDSPFEQNNLQFLNPAIRRMNNRTPGVPPTFNQFKMSPVGDQHAGYDLNHLMN